jgi:hypothetical protein
MPEEEDSECKRHYESIRPVLQQQHTSLETREDLATAELRDVERVKKCVEDSLNGILISSGPTPAKEFFTELNEVHEDFVLRREEYHNAVKSYKRLRSDDMPVLHQLAKKLKVQAKLECEANEVAYEAALQYEQTFQDKETEAKAKFEGECVPTILQRINHLHTVKEAEKGAATAAKLEFEKMLSNAKTIFEECFKKENERRF